MRLRTKVPLAPLTTLRLGGAAARMADIERDEDVVDAATDADARGDAIFVLGAGSNVVVADEGFSGLVARMATRGMRVETESGRVVVEVAAGETWDNLVGRAVDEGWCGVEALSAIPGLVGATPIQNVGAYGQEVSDTIESVRAFDRATGTFVYLRPVDCRFGYRSSAFKGSERWIVTSVRFSFVPGRTTPVRYAELARALSVADGALAPSRGVREAVIGLRRAKGMVLDPDDPESVSAGSFFVNPIVDASVLASVAARAGAPPPSFAVAEGRFKNRRGVARRARRFRQRLGPGTGWGFAQARACARSPRRSDDQ